MPSTYGPVFIGGPHRSGTGMLRAVIGSNSAIAIPPKEYQFFEQLGSPAQLESRNKKELLREVLGWPKIKAWGLTDADIGPFLSNPDTVKAVYSAPLLAYAAQMGKPGFGEKTPYLERNFEVLFDWFGPSMRFFHIMRDPFETYLSMTYYNQFSRCPTPEEFSHQWQLSLFTGLRHSSMFPENYLLLRYEDFVEDPRHWSELICEFGGLPKEIDQMLAMEHFERKRNSSFDVEEESRPRSHQIVRPNETARPSLSGVVNRLIENEVFPHAATIGYVRPAMQQP